jgi:hypothetical protein
MRSPKALASIDVPCGARQRRACSPWPGSMERRRGYIRTRDLQRFLTTYPRQAANGDQRLVWISTVLIGACYRRLLGQLQGQPRASSRAGGVKWLFR